MRNRAAASSDKTALQDLAAAAMQTNRLVCTTTPEEYISTVLLAPFPLTCIEEPV